MDIDEIKNIIFIEYIIKNEENDIVGTTVVYKCNGNILKYQTKSYSETCQLLERFVEQESSRYYTYDDLIKEGKISRLLIEDILEGNFREKNIGGFSFPNHNSFIINRRSDKYNKYQGSIVWKSSEKNNNIKNYNISFSRRSKINVKALLLALLVTGTISLLTIKGIKYIGKNKDVIQTMNYNGSIDENFINRIFNAFANGNEDKISGEELNKFVKIIHEIYSGNIELWWDDFVNKSRTRSAVICNFSQHFEDGTIDREVLNHFENGYNLNNYGYLDSSTVNYEANFTVYCKELYNFVFKNESFRNTNIKFSDLSPITQLIILEMFENCADVVDFYNEEYYAYSKSHEKIFNDQIMTQIETKKKSVIISMEVMVKSPNNFKK